MSKEVESETLVLVKKNVEAWLEFCRVHWEQNSVLLAEEKVITEHFAAVQDCYWNYKFNLDNYVDINIYASAAVSYDNDDDNGDDYYGSIASYEKPEYLGNHESKILHRE